MSEESPSNGSQRLRDLILKSLKEQFGPNILIGLAKGDKPPDGVPPEIHAKRMELRESTEAPPGAPPHATWRALLQAVTVAILSDGPPRAVWLTFLDVAVAQQVKIDHLVKAERSAWRAKAGAEDARIDQNGALQAARDLNDRLQKELADLKLVCDSRGARLDQFAETTKLRDADIEELKRNLERAERTASQRLAYLNRNQELVKQAYKLREANERLTGDVAALRAQLASLGRLPSPAGHTEATAESALKATIESLRSALQHADNKRKSLEVLYETVTDRPGLAELRTVISRFLLRGDYTPVVDEAGPKTKWAPLASSRASLAAALHHTLAALADLEVQDVPF